MCVRLHNDRSALGRGGPVTFVLPKVTKTVSAEMPLGATGLCAQNLGKPWAAIISPGYPIASIPCMRKLAMP